MSALLAHALSPVTATSNTVKLSAPTSRPPTSNSGSGPSASAPSAAIDDRHIYDLTDTDTDSDTHRELSPPPQYPASEAPSSPRPPPFSSLFSPPPPSPEETQQRCCSGKYVPSTVAATSLPPPTVGEASSVAPAYTEFETEALETTPFEARVAETKRSLPQDTKEASSSKDDTEPPPAYSEEGYSPLPSFNFIMAAAGGASSIITQVQQGGPPVNAIGDVGADETIAMDLRGTRFVLSRDELLTLPEFVLLSLFPNGLFPEGHMGGLSEGDAVQVDVSNR